MFQYATAYAIAKKHDTTVAISSKDAYYPDNQCNQLVETFELPHAILDNFGGITSHYNEPGFSYDPTVQNLPNGVDIRGYFQSEKYFQHIRFELLNKEFAFKPHVKTKGEICLSHFKTKKFLCSIHVRFGDYTKLQDVHYNLPTTYYLKCINKLSKQVDVTNVHYLVFSDDTDAAKVMFAGYENQMSFIGEDYQTSLYLMSKCDYHVMANSSYSWWGAWLSSSKITYAPSIWFASKGPQYWKDVYCSQWIVI